MGARANFGFMNSVMVLLSAATCAVFASGKFATGVPSWPGETVVCGVVLKFMDVFSMGEGEGPWVELCLSDLFFVHHGQNPIPRSHSTEFPE